ncbi:MAG: DegV family protein [Clostridiales bacterium]|nr:DegV family protein [Clostridiales bacterium]
MAKIRFITDSGSDLSLEAEREYGIVVIPFPVSFGEKTCLSRVDMTNREFYGMLEASRELPTHSQITVYQYTKLFEEAFADGVEDVINTTINAEGSGTYNSACLAAQMFFEANPQAEGRMRIHNLDGQSYTCAYGYPVEQGARMAAEGRSADEILSFMRDWLQHSVIYFAPFTLKYAAKSGRIPSAAAFVGELVGLKPIMRIHDHVIVTDDKVRGEKKAIALMAQKTAREIQPGTPYMVIYGDHPEDGEVMAKRLTEELGYPPAGMTEIGPVIAINAGPRVAAVMFHEKA